MKKKFFSFILLTFLLCSSALVKGIRSNNDRNQINDTSLINSYIKYSFKTKSFVPFAIYNSLEAFDLAKKINYVEGIDKIYKIIISSDFKIFDLQNVLNNDLNLKMELFDSLGYYYSIIGQQDKALECFRSIENHTELGNLKGSERLKISVLNGIAGCYKRIGISFLNQKDYEISVEYLNRALKIYEGLENRIGIGSCYNNIGISYISSGNYLFALENLLKSLKINEDIGYKIGLAHCNSNIAILYTNEKENSKAQAYAQKALKLFEEIKNQAGVLKCYSILGSININLHNYVKAIEFYKLSLKISEQLQDERNMANILNNIGDAYMNLENYSEAIEYFNKSLKINEKNDDKITQLILINNIANTYLKLKRYDEAIEYAKKSSKSAKEIKELYIENEGYRILKETYKLKADYRKAMEYADLYKNTGDSLYNSNKSKQMLEMQTKYETEKKETQILAQKKALAQKNKQIIFLSIAALLIFILTILTLILYFKRNIAYKYLVMKNIEVSKKSLELQEIKKDRGIDNEKLRIEKEEFKISDNFSEPFIRKSEEILKQLIDKVENEKIYLRHDITLEILAKEMETNRDYLSKVINKNFANFNEFINKYRIEESIRIITSDNNHKPLKVICSESGFYSYSPFQIAFKKHTGLTPGEFQKRLEI